MRKLKLDVAEIVPVHGAPVPWSDLREGVSPRRTDSARIRGRLAPAATDVDALRRELERDLEGEVRFDAVSRALYSTDASVYQIEPLGVVVVRSREDVVRTVRPAPGTAVR